METIKDYDFYTNEMKKGLGDKLYFLSHIQNAKTIVDFGCANGVLLNYLSSLRKYNLFGIDNDKEMLKLAKEMTSAQFIRGKSPKIDCIPPHSALILNSVIHEVYSYSNQSEIDEFWRDTFSSGYEYICIRDMFTDANPDKHFDTEKIKNKIAPKTQISDFESIWGPLDNEKNALHFLLKYRYIKNWKREVKENYFPINFQELLKLIPSNYKPVYTYLYTHPYQKSIIKADFGINIPFTTHANLILKKTTK